MAIKLFNSQTSMFCERSGGLRAEEVPYEVIDVRADERIAARIHQSAQVPTLTY
jgi:hypothetical protein